MLFWGPSTTERLKKLLRFRSQQVRALRSRPGAEMAPQSRRVLELALCSKTRREWGPVRTRTLGGSARARGSGSDVQIPRSDRLGQGHDVGAISSSASEETGRANGATAARTSATSPWGRVRRLRQGLPVPNARLVPAMTVKRPIPRGSPFFPC